MPSSRRLKVTGLIVLLTFAIIYYVTNGASNTRNSPFYTRTVAAINNRHDAQARESVIAEEQARLERVERLEKEHNAAISAAAAASAAAATAEGTSKLSGDAAKAAGLGAGPEKQKPLVEDVKEAADKESEAVSGEKSVAGRKKMKDEKVVDGKPATDDHDGVAKIGNVDPKASNVAKSDQAAQESDEDHEVETALNEILKKGPIIIFSKSYCPYSKKAKHVLLDLYTMSPPPYVVELDQHPLGQGLQAALEKTTGRRTVPNILINAKSIGGGDDIQALHDNDKIVDTISAMGGKRILKIEKKGSSLSKRSEVKFEA